jgi:hypothetical protein
MSLNSEEPKDPKLSPDEIFQAFQIKLAEYRDMGQNHKTTIPQVLDIFQAFLEEKPEPPESWKIQVGDKADKFDYHQIVLPQDHCDPYKLELENIEIIRDSGRYSMALEHALISRNYFIFTDGHADSIPAPKPLLMLESHENDNAVDWDCCFYIWPDGSFYSYNLEGEHEENSGEDALEIVKIYRSVITNLVLKVPQEGVDFGHLVVGE